MPEGREQDQRAYDREDACALQGMQNLAQEISPAGPSLLDLQVVCFFMKQDIE